MTTRLVAMLLWLGAGLAPALAQNCPVEPDLVETFTSFVNVHRAVTKDRKLDILVVSAAPSQTGAASGLKSYPSFLETALQERLKGVAVSVYAFALPRKPVEQVAAALPELLKERKPNLVIWQTGTVEAIRGIDPDVYGDQLLAGVGEIKAAKADVILINQQYSPRTDMLFDGTPYTNNMRWVSQVRDAALFNRYAIMRFWAENGVFDLSGMKSDGTYEKLHRCLGVLLSDFIIRGGSLPGRLE